MDQFDRASELEQQARDIAIEKAKQAINFNNESETHCIRCDDEIPEARRRLGGIKRCVPCQQLLER